MGVIAKGIPRGCQGLFTPVSLGYPLSVFNKNSTLKSSSSKLFKTTVEKREEQRGGLCVCKCACACLCVCMHVCAVYVFVFVCVRACAERACVPERECWRCVSWYVCVCVCAIISISILHLVELYAWSKFLYREKEISSPNSQELIQRNNRDSPSS